MHGSMNDTKWDELRLAMYAIRPAPKWRTKDVHSGFTSPWDGEWYYHFRDGGYDSIEFVEIRAEDPQHLDSIVASLRAIHVPGVIEGDVVTVYGHIEPGEAVDWI